MGKYGGNHGKSSVNGGFEWEHMKKNLQLVDFPLKTSGNETFYECGWLENPRTKYLYRNSVYRENHLTMWLGDFPKPPLL